MHSKPEGVSGDYHPQTGWYVFKMTFTQEPPVRLGVMVGEVAHNLRSALDHLIWQLVLAGGEKPGRANQFPIYVTESDFLADVEGRDEARRGPGPLAGLDSSGPEWAFVKGLQPYHGGNDPENLPIARLRWLSNEDKHRIVRPTYLAVGGPPGIALIDFRSNAEVVEDVVSLKAGQRLEDGTEILRVRLAHAGDEPEVEMDANFQVQIVFGERALTLQDLGTIAQFVQKVVQLSERFFDP